jgi:predicted GNAT family N-acyltransferase
MNEDIFNFKKIYFNTPEYSEALAIRREVFITEQKVPENIEIDEFECNSHHFLLTINDEPAACGRMRSKGPFIKFERVATLKKYRGKGIGKKLMEGMQDFAQVNYPELIPFMHSQLEATNFYEKLGWTKAGEVFFEAGIPHLVMKLIS